MYRRFRNITLLALAIVAMGGAAMPSPGKKAKKTMTATVVADTLGYNDSRRYDYFFLEAVRQQEEGHYAAAFDLLRHCLEINPKAAEAYFLKARFLSMLRQDTLALQCLEKAAELRPGNGIYQEKVAQFYIGMGDYAKSTNAYERLFANNRDRSDVLNVLVQLYQQQKDYDKMLDAIGKMEELEGADDQFELAKMNVFETKGDYHNAYLTLKRLADKHPNDKTFAVMLGNWLMQHKRQKDAYKLFAQTLKESPDNTYAQSSMYDYYRSTGKDSLARQMMERILMGKNTPEDSRAQFLKQAIQENERNGGDSSVIMSLMDRMAQVVPKDVSLAEMRAAYCQMKKMPEAQVDTALVRLLGLAPDNASARFQLIQNKWASQDWKAIAALAEPGMLYNPDEMAFYYFTGLARYYQGDDKGALDAFQRGTAEINDKSNPDIVSDFYAIMGEIYHSQGETDKAYAAFDSCLQWKPDHAMTLNNYAYFLSQEGGDLKKAEQMSAKAVKSEPNNATFLDTYAWILYKQGRYAEAKIYMDATLKNSSEDSIGDVVLEHAADIYMEVGEKSKALDFLQKAIDAGGDKSALTRKMNLYRKEK
ncbi:MAG TPA: hypothetical protein DD401_02745 [Prevotella sp.]|nr:hypothetical protein [Prevotella sp.]